MDDYQINTVGFAKWTLPEIFSKTFEQHFAEFAAICSSNYVLEGGSVSKFRYKGHVYVQRNVAYYPPIPVNDLHESLTERMDAWLDADEKIRQKLTKVNQLIVLADFYCMTTQEFRDFFPDCFVPIQLKDLPRLNPPGSIIPESHLHFSQYHNTVNIIYTLAVDTLL